MYYFLPSPMWQLDEPLDVTVSDIFTPYALCLGCHISTGSYNTQQALRIGGGALAAEMAHLPTMQHH